MTLRANMEGAEAATFKRGDRTYDIVVKLEEEEGKDQIRDFLFPGTPGHSLLLTNLARIEEGLSPVQITRKDKRRVAKFFSNLAKSKPLGKAVAEISAAINGSLQVDEVLKLIIKHTSRLFPAQVCQLVLYDGEKQVLQSRRNGLPIR